MKRLTVLCTVILLVLLSVTLVISCKQQPASAPTPALVPSPSPTPTAPPPPPVSETLTYTNSGYDFSVQYPKDWDFLEDYMGMVVLLAGPSITLITDHEYMVNISIGVSELPEKMTLEELVKMGELQDKRSIPNYNKVKEYDTTIAGLPANVQTITGTIKLGEDDVLLKDAIARFVTDKVVYVITYDGPEEFHDEYLDAFELVVSTFKFK